MDRLTDADVERLLGAFEGPEPGPATRRMVEEAAAEAVRRPAGEAAPGPSGQARPAGVTAYPEPAGRRRFSMRLWVAAAGLASAIAVAVTLHMASGGGYPAPAATGDFRVEGGAAPARGFSIATERKSAAVELGGYCRVRMEPGSRLTIEGSPRAEAVLLARGFVSCEVDRSVGAFAVRTSVGTVSVTGTRFIVGLIEEEGGRMRMLVKVIAGSVLVAGAWGEFALAEGHEKTVPEAGGVAATAAAVPAGLEAFKGSVVGKIVSCDGAGVVIRPTAINWENGASVKFLKQGTPAASPDGAPVRQGDPSGADSSSTRAAPAGGYRSAAVGGAPVQVTVNRLVDEKQRARMDEAVKLLGGELRLAYDSPAAGDEANRTYHEELRREIERLAKQGGPVMAKAAVEGTKGLVMATIAAYQEPPEKSVLEKAYEREGADNANGRNAP